MSSVVDVVLVNYNAKDPLLACLSTLQSHDVGRIVVVDNASSDGSDSAVLAQFPQVDFVSSGANLGFGRAVNLGVEKTNAPLVLICNPDIEIHENAVARLVEAIDSNVDLAAVGPLIFDSGGQRYPSARMFPRLSDAIGHAFVGLISANNRFSRTYKMTDLDITHRQDVDWISAACLLTRRTAFDAIGGFDPRYFMYMEDVDLCWRWREAGWGVAFEPSATITHLQGYSAERRAYRMIVEHHRSLWQFLRRTTSGRSRLLLPLMSLGLAIRLGMALLQRRFRRGPTRQ